MREFIEPQNILMIDLETKDVTVTSEIIEVAAILYTKRQVVNRLHFYTAMEQAYLPYFTTSNDTLKFHIVNKTKVLEQQLRATILESAVPYSGIIKEINQLTSIVPNDTMIYCFGLNFDLPILNYTAQQTNSSLMLPSYRSLRCLRTELATAEALGFTYGKSPTAHNAMDDCMAQVNLLYKIFDFYKELTNGTNN